MQNNDANDIGDNTPVLAEKTHNRQDTTRRQTVVFVLVFVFIVMGLLTAYRYAIDTRLNDWYLFTLAKHTAMALDKVGDSATLESDRRIQVSPNEARASIDAWLRGEKAPTDEEVEKASSAPLSPWESWSYRALKKRYINPELHDGPHVTFVWQPGVYTKIIEREFQRDRLMQDQSLPESEKLSQIAKLTAEITALQSERSVLMRNPQKNTGQQDKFFSFIIIPECGAIEIMAIFFAAVVAFPTTWGKKVLGLLLGIPLMYLVNIFRLTCLGVIGALDTTPTRQWFNFAHEYLWQVVYIVFVVFVWLAWVEFMVRRRQNP